MLFDPCKRATGRVDRFCTVRFDTNNYSVPADYCGREVSLKIAPEEIFIYYNGKCIAEHPRRLERRQNIYTLDHYLPLLEKKGRAVFYAKPVQEAIPEYILNWLEKQELTPKELVELLRRFQNEDYKDVMSETPHHSAPEKIEDCVAVRPVDLHVYDAFLSRKTGATV